jgi:hypothetical protein
LKSYADQIRALLPESEELVNDTGKLLNLVEAWDSDCKQHVKENNILRGLLGKSSEPCVHCGLLDMSLCVSGFPGCARADDILCGEEAAWGVQRVLMENLKKRVSELQEELDKYPK